MVLTKTLRVLAIGLVSLAVIAVVGCSKKKTEAAAPGAEGVMVMVSSSGFQPNRIDIAPGQPMVLRVMSDDKKDHKFVIDQLGVNVDVPASGQQVMVELTGKPAGTYSFYSETGGAKEPGVEGTLMLGMAGAAPETSQAAGGMNKSRGGDPPAGDPPARMTTRRMANDTTGWRGRRPAEVTVTKNGFEPRRITVTRSEAPALKVTAPDEQVRVRIARLGVDVVIPKGDTVMVSLRGKPAGTYPIVAMPTSNPRQEHKATLVYEHAMRRGTSTGTKAKPQTPGGSSGY